MYTYLSKICNSLTANKLQSSYVFPKTLTPKKTQKPDETIRTNSTTFLKQKKQLTVELSFQDPQHVISYIIKKKKKQSQALKKQKPKTKQIKIPVPGINPPKHQPSKSGDLLDAEEPSGSVAPPQGSVDHLLPSQDGEVEPKKKESEAKKGDFSDGFCWCFSGFACDVVVFLRLLDGFCWCFSRFA